MTFTPPTAKTTGQYVKDLVERVVMTFVTTFLGTLVTGGVFDVAGVRNIAAYQAAAIAAAAAVLSLFKGLVAKWVGRRDSASLVPGV